MTRGPERSRKLADVVREVTDLARGGTTEVTLLGQTSTATTTVRTTSPTCCARWARSPACAGCGSRLRIHGFHRRRGRRHGGDARRVRARAPPGAERLVARPQADAAALRSGPLSRVVAALRGAVPASLSRPTSSSDSQARPKTIPGDAVAGRAGGVRRCVHLQVLAARGDARDPAQGCRADAVAGSVSSAWWPPCEASRAAGTSGWSAARTKCWSRGAPSGVSCCRAAPAPTRWRSSRAPTAGSAATATCASPAPPAPPSRPCRSAGPGARRRG